MRNEIEFREQCALFKFLRAMSATIPLLRRVHATPNGLYLGPATAGKAKAQGVRKGVWDILVTSVQIQHDPNYPRSPRIYGGLWIEMKAPGQKLTEEQEEFRKELQTEYAFVICYRWDEAAVAICRYLGLENHPTITANLPEIRTALSPVSLLPDSIIPAVLLVDEKGVEK